MQRAPRAPASDDLQGMLHLIDRLYAAAAAEAPWPQALAELRRQGGFDGCLLTSIDPKDRRPFVLCLDATQRPSNGVPGILPPNPLLTDSVLASAAGALWSDRELLPWALLRSTAFWSEWMLPEGFVSWGCMIVGRRGDQVICLDLYTRARSAALDAQARHVLSTLTPHLTRAWRLAEAQRPLVPEAKPGLASGPGPRELHGLPRPARLRAAFGLTKAEARLAVALADGCSPAEAARDFEVKLTTVRTQLQQIFAKTGTSRQAELVAVLLAQS